MHACLLPSQFSKNWLSLRLHFLFPSFNAVSLEPIISLHCVRVGKKVDKLELFAEWIFVLCACGNLKTISLLWVTVRMDGLFGDNIQKLKMRNWDKNFRYYSRTILLKSVFLTAYQLNCFYRAIREDCFFERSHFLITLTSSLYYLFLQRPGEQQNWTSSTWDIFKSQFVTWFVSFNFCIFLLLIIKTKTLHNHYERIISCKHL